MFKIMFGYLITKSAGKAAPAAKFYGGLYGKVVH